MKPADPAGFTGSALSQVFENSLSVEGTHCVVANMATLHADSLKNPILREFRRSVLLKPMHHVENDEEIPPTNSEATPHERTSTPSLADLFNEFFPELHRVAKGAMVKQRASHTLQATALVNECYLRLSKAGKQDWTDRKHFLNSASLVMRNILVDHFRRKSADKRPKNRIDFELDYIVADIEEQGVDLEKLELALKRLEEEQPDRALLVQLKFYCGLEMKEIADALQLQQRTLERRWETTRAWLFLQMQ